MKTKYLLPHTYKPIGWILFSLGLIGGLFFILNDYQVEFLNLRVLSVYTEGHIFNDNPGFFRIVENSIADELVALLIIVGGLLTGFSREKIEDEFTAQLRKDSLVWALLINYGILLVTLFLVYDLAFFHVLVFNMFTPLVLFVFRFNFIQYFNSKNEE